MGWFRRLSRTRQSIRKPTVRESRAAERTMKAETPAQGSTLGAPKQTVSSPVGSPSQAGDSKIVIILPNETLYQISVKNFGKYDEATLAIVRALNPWLDNPDHIEAGQKIRVPGPSSTSPTSLPTAERVPAAIGTEAEKP